MAASLLAEIEQAAVSAAWQAGNLVSERFGGVLDVRSKGKKAGEDLVTDVDSASQRLIKSLTVDKFPGHMLLGEEDAPDSDPVAADFVWAVDPIDGTTNFVNGLPLHAVSAGVLFRGTPVVGAIWVPWPVNGGQGAVIHARQNGGAIFATKAHPDATGRTLTISDAESEIAPKTGRLSAIPGGLRYGYHVGSKLRKGIGEPRVSGSTAYETAMVATGVVQFSVSGSGSHVWDYAASSVIVKEAGGEVYIIGKGNKWEPFNGWLPYANDTETSAKLRKWSGPLLMSTPRRAAFLAQQLRPRRPSLWQRAKKSFIKQK